MSHENELDDFDSQVIVRRQWFDDHWTIGELYILREFECFTLEDTCRDPNKSGRFEKEEKIAGETAIPAGRYELIINRSNRFKKDLPLLLNVPYFEGIRIHDGNTSKDTRGCILVGLRKGEGVIYDSDKALENLMEKLKSMLKKEKVFINVIGGVSV